MKFEDKKYNFTPLPSVIVCCGFCYLKCSLWCLCFKLLIYIYDGISYNFKVFTEWPRVCLVQKKINLQKIDFCLEHTSLMLIVVVKKLRVWKNFTISVYFIWYLCLSFYSPNISNENTAFLSSFMGIFDLAK